MSPASAASGEETACAVTLTRGTTSLVFERAYFGFNGVPPTSLHIELHRGGDEGCPHAASATPLQTLVLGNVPLGS
ncbi:MAG: hypothetical protein IPL79_10170 [Myxococcales bacterium]|nr:hypothetical protein [Myxococcales bacterium]